MLILHAALHDGCLLLWGESPVDQPQGDRSGGATNEHPHAADHNTLVAALEQQGAGRAAARAARDWAGAWLPSRGRSPLPSSHLLGDPAASRAQVRVKCWRVPVLSLGPGDAVAVLTAYGSMPRRTSHGIVAGAGVRVLAQIVRHAAAIVLRQEFLPDLREHRGGEGDGGGARDVVYDARWTALPRPDARDELQRLGAQLPASASALVREPEGMRRRPAGAQHLPAQPAEQLINTFVDSIVDDLVRATLVTNTPTSAAGDDSLHDRWLAALGAPDTTVAGPPDALDRLADDVRAWQHRLRRVSLSPFRTCLRLEEPTDPEGDGEDSTVWYLRFQLQSRAEPSVIVDFATAWSPRGADAATLRRLGFHTGEHLLAPLGEAARLCEHVEASLRDRQPSGCELDAAEAHAFLAETAPLLEQAGFAVFVPAWWRGRRGRFQLNVRAKVRTKLTGGRQGLASLNLDTLVDYDWRLAIGDAELSQRELRELAAQKAPLVRVRGKWVELDQSELSAALAYIDRRAMQHARPKRDQGVATLTEEGALTATIGQLVGMSVGGGPPIAGLPVGGVSASGTLADLLTELVGHETPVDPEPPAGLHATLRPYQQRGFAWLAYMTQLGLGACLADDMGLGKSVQTLAQVQHAWEGDTTACAPTLIVCPTSVVTNWLRECERFTPELPVLVHHGSSRLRGDKLQAAAGSSAVVLTSYQLLARDIEDLLPVPWRVVVLDEAQNIKNPGTRHAVAARALRAPGRVALTGTPIENSVGDLWSIMEFLNPGLLGSQVDFRRRYMLPIQTGTFPEAGERLRRLTAPFILRRVKTDRSVIADLPDKFEATAFCTLTTEQVTLYEAVVREAERIVTGKAPRGVERRGVILATLSKLKQVCNHPAQFLADGSRIEGRSGKLTRLEGLLEQVLENGERALVFTQFVGMGELLQRHLRETFGREVVFLHGGVSRTRRDELVERFQAPGTGAPPIFVLSLKAGGSGLNLTAATHVFHFDRWWNPATEQQASDRAFRIGQTRDVQVHSFVCAGTVEEEIDHMLQRKRGIADSIIGGDDERWITELPDDELFELLRLREDTLLQEGRLDDTGKEWSTDGRR